MAARRSRSRPATRVLRVDRHRGDPGAVHPHVRRAGVQDPDRIDGEQPAHRRSPAREQVRVRARPPSPIERKLLPIDPIKRGDVVVFKYPGGARARLHQARDRAAGRNAGAAARRRSTSTASRSTSRTCTSCVAADAAKARRWRRYDVRERYGPVTVPADQYFVMGDNRDNSQDSRYWGFLPRDYVKGKALMVYWSYEAGPRGLPGGRARRRRCAAPSRSSRTSSRARAGTGCCTRSGRTRQSGIRSAEFEVLSIVSDVGMPGAIEQFAILSRPPPAADPVRSQRLAGLLTAASIARVSRCTSASAPVENRVVQAAKVDLGVAAGAVRAPRRSSSNATPASLAADAIAATRHRDPFANGRVAGAHHVDRHLRRAMQRRLDGRRARSVSPARSLSAAGRRASPPRRRRCPDRRGRRGGRGCAAARGSTPSSAARSASVPVRVLGSAATIMSREAPTAPASADAEPPPGVGVGDANDSSSSVTVSSVSLP